MESHVSTNASQTEGNASLPFARTYWVDAGKLLAGAYPGSRDLGVAKNNLTGMVDCGIRHVINLMEEHETNDSGKPFVSYEKTLSEIAMNRGVQVTCTRVPIKDMSAPAPEVMRSILDQIDSDIQKNLPVYVHCWGGRGRTGTVVGCYLVRHGLSGEEALERINFLRKKEPTGNQPSPQTTEQFEMVRKWKQLDSSSAKTAFKEGDHVEVLAGKHKGKTGVVQNYYAPRDLYRVKLDEDAKVVAQKEGKIKLLKVVVQKEHGIKSLNKLNTLERFKGSLVGLAVGDALGTTVEFKEPGTFPPLTDIVGGGPFHLKAGEWTDDTSMALCLAQSLIDKNGFDPADQMDKYLKWYLEGYMSSNGRCFDIGNTIREALLTYEKTREPYAGPTGIHSAGNGSIMRLAPVPLFYSQEAEAAIERSALSSKTTHGALAAVDACRYMGALLFGAINGASKEEFLSEAYCPIPGYWEIYPLAPEIDEIARGSFKRRNPPQINGKGYVVSTLEAALWAFFHTDSFEAGCIKVVNLGKDADTTGAVYGQIAGAYYGYGGIPEAWKKKIAKLSLIESTAGELLRVGSVHQSGNGNGEKRAKGQGKYGGTEDQNDNSSIPETTETTLTPEKQKELDLARSFIQSYQASKSGLKKLGILRREGDIVGDYAEWLAAGMLGLELAQNSIQEGWDAKDADGRTYQIKCRTVQSINSYTSFNFNEVKKNFDFLLGVFLSPNLELLGIIKVPYQVVEELSHTNKRNARFRWSKKIADHPKIRKIYWRTEETNARDTNMQDRG